MSESTSINFRTKTVCFVDNGLFMGFARTVGAAFKKAYYFSPWASPFTSVRRTKLGVGFPEFEVTLKPLALADEIDLWVFLDVFHDDLQTFLAQHGARVWGARSGEELELQRADFKGLLKDIGLPVGPWELCTGTDELRKYLKTKKNVFIKGDSGYTRGDMETWKWKNEHVSGPRMDEIEYDLGAFKNTFRFVVEDEIADAVEIGYDGYTVDGQFPSPSMQGIEIKGLGLLGIAKPYDQLTPAVRLVNTKLADEFRRHQYRGFMCMEMRKTKAPSPFVLDPCCRPGSPSNEVLQELFTDWPRVMWEGAEGKLVSAKQVAKYGMVAMIYNEQSGKNVSPLKYPASVDKWVKVRNGARIDGKTYSIPQGAPGNIAGVVGIGNTILEAVTMCAENAQQVDGHGIEISLDAISKAVDEIEKGSKYGVEFTTDRLPSVAELKKAVGG